MVTRRFSATTEFLQQINPLSLNRSKNSSAGACLELANWRLKSCDAISLNEVLVHISGRHAKEEAKSIERPDRQAKGRGFKGRLPQKERPREKKLVGQMVRPYFRGNILL